MKQKQDKQESAGLRFLYHTAPGRVLLRLLTARWVSKCSGALLDSPLSRPLIDRFFKKNKIDPSDYLPERYRSFNECFCRKIRPELRPIDSAPTHLIAPCDGLLSVYRISGDTVLPVKQSQYRIPTLLGDEALAAQYQNGYCFVFRLCVHHYHRYIYPDSGYQGENRFLPGRLHTVRPIALEQAPVFLENCRSCATLDSDHFGTLTQIEVGAMLVGRICNLHGAGSVVRGAEKGFFQYGGSTVILLVRESAILPPTTLLSATARGEETPITLGSAIAYAPVTEKPCVPPEPLATPLATTP